MVAETAISIEEYLNTSFEGPDREYLDGKVVERSMPRYSHSEAQNNLCGWFYQRKWKLRLFGCPELRVQISANRVRVIDLAVYAGNKPEQQIPSQPPFIAIEIVSPDDRHSEIIERLGEYHRWGVTHNWLVDPWIKTLSIYADLALWRVPHFELPEYSLKITPAEIFD
ncbi:MAG: Uma2 family endonuclease [Acidobacteriota bacterium]|nr:Uma2 family endonuclease [Acidobacteriota bacterium]